jgi:hypothetical protein
MYTSQSVGLDLDLDIIGHFVARIQATIFGRLVTDLQQIVHFLLVNAYAPSDLCQALVSGIAGLIDYVDIKEILLLVEESSAEVVELCRINLLDSIAGFVNKRRGWMPWLNLLAEDGHDAVTVLVQKSLAEVGGVHSLEHLLAERAHIVEILRRSVSSASIEVEALTKLERVHSLWLYSTGG